jgi:hypothetical protein
MKSLKIIIPLLLIFLIGCSVHLRSPIVFKKTPEKEKTAQRPEKILPPPPLKKTESPDQSSTSKQEPDVTEESVIPEEISEESSLYNIKTETVEATIPKGKIAISTARNIIILAPEYLKDTEYNVLEKIIVKDVSQVGFNRQEAREALQFEAFRRFGTQAKGITNIIYGEKSGFIPDSKGVFEVSGEIITWEGKTPPKKKPIENEKETASEPENQPEPPVSSPETTTEPPISEPSSDTKTNLEEPAQNTVEPEQPASSLGTETEQTNAPPSDIKTDTNAAVQGSADEDKPKSEFSVSSAQTKLETPLPSAPGINEQKFED